MKNLEKIKKELSKVVQSIEDWIKCTEECGRKFDAQKKVCAALEDPDARRECLAKASRDYIKCLDKCK